MAKKSEKKVVKKISPKTTLIHPKKDSNESDTIRTKDVFRPITAKNEPYSLTVAKSVLAKLQSAITEFHSFGISFDSRLMQHEAEIDAAIKRGVVLNITMLSTKADLVNIAPQFGQSPTELRQELEVSLENVKRLEEKYPGKCIVHFIKRPPLYRLFASDLDRRNHLVPNTVIFFYGIGTDIHGLPAYEFNYSDSNPASKHIDDYLRAVFHDNPSHKMPQVFLIHGRDKVFNEKVRVFLSQHGIEHITLDSQANEGKTVIEKFEKHSNVHYAIVLLTPDDLGCFHEECNCNKSWGKRAAACKPRVRENVMFEWGYLMAKLGRERVACLMKDSLELPSDLKGIVWHPVNGDDDSIPVSVLRELEQAGFPIVL